MKAYCVKCKAKTEIAGAVESELNGRKVAKGKCSKCGTGMFKMLPTKTTAANPLRDGPPITVTPRRGPLGVRV